MKVRKQIRETRTRERLRSLVSDFIIASKYFHVDKIPYLCKSPVREDRKRSFCFYSKDGSTIMWTDYAKNESGDMIKLCSILWNVGYYEALNMIWDDLIGKEDNELEIRQKYIRHEPLKTSSTRVLGIKSREWNEDDISYWSRFGIDINTLKQFDVYPAAFKVIDNEGEPRKVFKLDKLAYAYVEHKEGKQTMKIYQPMNKQFKWDNSHTKDVIALWSHLPLKADKVFICSSVKDALCLYCNTGYAVCAVQGESMTLSDTAANELRKRFDNVFILFDSDKAGIEDARKLSEVTGFLIISLPESKAFKDVAEFYENLTDKGGLKILIDILVYEQINRDDRIV